MEDPLESLPLMVIMSTAFLRVEDAVEYPIPVEEVNVSLFTLRENALREG